MIKKSIDTWAIYNVDKSNRKKNGGSATYVLVVCRHYGYTTVA